MPNQIDPIYDLVDLKNIKAQQKIAGMYPEKTEKVEIKRLYKHHCFYDYNSRDQLALIKDISRVGCPENKYIIFDSDI
jgi:hypothetical protein